MSSAHQSAAVGSALGALIASAANPSEPVKLSNSFVSVRGIGVLEFISILRDFPRIRNVILGVIGAAKDDLDEAGQKKRDEETAKQFAELVMDFGPEAVATIVAAGIGRRNDPEAIAAVLNLGDDDLEKLLGAIIEKTMPEGIQDFFGRLKRLAEKMGLKPDAKAPDSGSAGTASKSSS